MRVLGVVLRCPVCVTTVLRYLSRSAPASLPTPLLTRSIGFEPPQMRSRSISAAAAAAAADNRVAAPPGQQKPSSSLVDTG
jgi:hypothetical protein